MTRKQHWKTFGVTQSGHWGREHDAQNTTAVVGTSAVAVSPCTRSGNDLGRSARRIPRRTTAPLGPLASRRVVPAPVRQLRIDSALGRTTLETSTRLRLPIRDGSQRVARRNGERAEARRLCRPRGDCRVFSGSGCCHLAVSAVERTIDFSGPCPDHRVLHLAFWRLGGGQHFASRAL